MERSKLDKIKALYGKAKAPVKQFADKGKGKPCPEKKALLKGSCIILVFPKTKQNIDIVKRIDKRRYVKGDDIQYWEVPLTLENYNKVKRYGFQITDLLHKWYESLFTPVKYDPAFTLPGLLHPLFPYQYEGVQFIESRNGRVLLADDQGLGKTAQVIAWLHKRKDIKTVLIVCPAMLKINWAIEFEFFTGNTNTQVIYGSSFTQITENIVIINYDILTTLLHDEYTIRDEIWGIKWDAIILDEAHYISNKESIRGWAIEQLVKRCKHVIPITATPGKNRPKEIFTLINYVNSQIFPSFYSYGHRYCGAKKGYMGKWTFDGSSNELELNEILTSSIMLRRKKTDVFKNLDRKIREVIPIEITNRKEYDDADNDFTQWLMKEGKKQSKENALYKLKVLEQIAVRGKMSATVEYLNDLLETEDKLVVWCEHKETVQALYKAFESISVVVDGSTSPAKREQAKQLFQQCKRCKVRKEKHDFDKKACKEYIPDLSKRVFIGTRAAKEGNTLTAAFYNVFVELWWSPMDHDQAEDRVYGRAGDLHGAICAYLVAFDTIEEHKARIYDLKNSSLTKVMDGKEVSEEHILTQLLKQRRT